MIPIPGCDVTMPVMGLGTWAWGDRSTWGMDGYDPSYGFDTIRGAYARAIAAGVLRVKKSRSSDAAPVA